MTQTCRAEIDSGYSGTTTPVTGIAPNRGVVVSVRGSVVDVRFDTLLPPIYSLLCAGKDGRIVIEVLSQIDSRQVRGIALTPTQGLARGVAIEDTGGPLQAPVDKEILSRMSDVFGNAIDRQPDLAGIGAQAGDANAPAIRWRSVHQDPPSLGRRSTKSEIFETGIKAIDAIIPIGRGQRELILGDRQTGKTAIAIDVAKSVSRVGGEAQFAAYRAVRAASEDLPADIRQRFEAGAKLSDEDRGSVIEIARKSLAAFQPEIEATARPMATVKEKS